MFSESDRRGVGGTVQAGGGIYIPRQADEELLALCRARTFAYILAPRQVGKSSLMVRTAEQLADEGIQSMIIDLTQLGVQVTAEEWYLGLLTIIADQLMLDTDVVVWWQSLKHLGITQRLTRFFEEILLVEIAIPLVIFVDEIDTTLSLDFTDDFFAAIRSLYNGRARIPKFQRLSFVLIGVATPGDLIRDSKRTPFNIGQRVELTDFNLQEALTLADGLGLPLEQSQQMLKWVLNWTGGHPYLTQRLCRAITEQDNNNWSQAEVDRVVNSTFFGAMSKQDNNLQFVRDMLTKRAPDLFAVLTTYSEIRRGKRIVLDEEQSLVKSHLKLSGIIVRREHASLCVRNLIYRKVFDDRWLKEHLPVKLKMLTVVITSIAVTFLTLSIRELQWLQPWELRVYDQMLRSRPSEAPDRRILLVKITDEDLKREKWLLSDRTINQLLKKIESYQPRIVGLYLFRPEDNNLAANLQNQDNLVTTCLFSSLGRDEIPPPPNVPIDNVGFSDVVADNENDQILRRSLLFANSTDKKCTTSFAFGAQIAINYLAKQGIEYDFTKKGDFLLGKTLFPRLQPNSGGYRYLDADGYQILLNYRHPNSLADQVTLTDVLNGRVNPSLFKDRLVIIGTTAANLPPGGFYTPYSALQDQPARMPALFIHAQIASQLISTVLDGRPLFWYWPDWAEFTWVWGWSLLGGILAWRWQNPLLLLVVVGITLFGLVVICVALFLQAGWVPLVPSALALVVTSGSVVSQRTISETQ
ncbi:CHASE2 domain-containing protein [Nostoc sp.]|uniref:CHASE2 domain-containing protein n=1 Tax=Nostoc sp. TaxID=1180 RepID=UPI002FFC0972